MSHLNNIINAHKGHAPMGDLAKSINRRADSQITNASTLYSYTTRNSRPTPKQAGMLARYMATNSHERAEILVAYLEDTLAATDIVPSERGLQIVLAVAEAMTDTVSEDQASYNNDRPDRERDLGKLADAWHRDEDLRQLLHSLARLID